MEAPLREIRVALLEADVHFRVVKQFIEAIRANAAAIANQAVFEIPEILASLL
jgi:signal recognition particle GTPase